MNLLCMDCEKIKVECIKNKGSINDNFFMILYFNSSSTSISPAKVQQNTKCTTDDEKNGKNVADKKMSYLCRVFISNTENAYKYLKDMEKAKTFLLTVALFAASVNLFSQTAEEWKKLGNIELESDNYKKAIEYYQKALEVDSNYFDAYFNIGLSFYYMQELDKAIEFSNKAITIQDTIADTYLVLGRIYVEKGQFEEAMQYIEKAAQLGDTWAQQFLNDNVLWEDNFVKPDYEQIKLNIDNNQSNFYYSNLWDRFQQGDNTMTLDEKRHLYYGYVFHKNYSPYLFAHDYQQINAILQTESPTKEDFEKLVSLLNVSLHTEPFSLRYLYYQSAAYHALGDSVDAERNQQKIRIIADALTSTGNGLSKETAIHVISIASEYDYLFLNDLSTESQALVSGGYDVLSLQPNEMGLEELWFDVNQPFNFNTKAISPKKSKKSKK